MCGQDGPPTRIEPTSVKVERITSPFFGMAKEIESIDEIVDRDETFTRS